MKISNNFKAISKTFIGLMVLSVGLTACSKKFDSEPVKVAGISFINASPIAGDFDVIVGNARANGDKTFKYNDKLDYLGLYPGIVGIGITKKGETNFIVGVSESFQPGKAYSIFVVEALQKSLLKLEDDLTVPEGNKVKIRFVNASPDAPALSFGIKGQATDLATNKPFKTFSDFLTIDASDKVTFEIKDNATKAVKASLVDVKIEKGKIYTIYAKGLQGPAAPSVSFAKVSAAADVPDEFKFGVGFFEHK